MGKTKYNIALGLAMFLLFFLANLLLVVIFDDDIPVIARFIVLGWVVSIYSPLSSQFKKWFKIDESNND